MTASLRARIERLEISAAGAHDEVDEETRVLADMLARRLEQQAAAHARTAEEHAQADVVATEFTAAWAECLAADRAYWAQVRPSLPRSLGTNRT